MEFAELKHQMPRYKCHKIVSACKIFTVLTHIDGLCDLTMETPEGTHLKARMSADWAGKNYPDKGGFLVMHDNGDMGYSTSSDFLADYIIED